MNFISYNQQYIDKSDIKEVNRSLKEKLITSGKYVEKFENNLKKYFGSKYIISTNNGTSALYLAIRSLKLKKNSIVIMPAINFIASFNICSLLGMKIFLADVDKLTGQMSHDNVIQCIKKNKIKKVNLIINMYLGGAPENSVEFKLLKNKLNCYLIEDACHAFGAKYEFKKKFYKIGSCKHSDISIFSFHPLKSITTGEGGVISTNNSKVFQRAKILRTHGFYKKNYWNYDLKENSLNFRLSDINCALGVSQLRKLDKFIKKRNLLAKFYYKELKKINYIELPNYKNSNILAWHLFLVKIDFSLIKRKKNDFIKYMKKNNIMSFTHYIPIYKFKSVYYNNNTSYFHGSEEYFKNVVSIPIFFTLSKKKQLYIVKTIKAFLKKK